MSLIHSVLIDNAKAEPLRAKICADEEYAFKFLSTITNFAWIDSNNNNAHLDFYTNLIGLREASDLVATIRGEKDQDAMAYLNWYGSFSPQAFDDVVDDICLLDLECMSYETFAELLKEQ